MAYSEDIQEILSKPTCTVPEAARVLGIGLRQCYEGIRKEEIPSIRIGNRILISTKRLMRFIEGE